MLKFILYLTLLIRLSLQSCEIEAITPKFTGGYRVGNTWDTSV